MIRSAICLIAALLLMTGCSPAATNNNVAVDVAGSARALLATQSADWNNGDVRKFMDGYWRDDQVRFASGGEVKRGWALVLSDYERRYPDRAAMGKLRTAGIEISEISNDAALVFGQWIVTANDSNYCGLFTLLVREIDGRWVVVHDHTSSGNDGTAAGKSCDELASGA